MLGLGLLFLPFTGPAKGLLALVRHIAGEAEGALYDEGSLRDALLALELRLQEGEIGQEEFVRTEAELLERLAEAWRRRPQV